MKTDKKTTEKTAKQTIKKPANKTTGPVALSPREIAAALVSLPGWTVSGNSLKRSWKFKDFRQAIGFIVRVGFEAEQRNHHPEIHNVYSTVELSLSTHDADGRVTQLDVDLAKAVNAL